MLSQMAPAYDMELGVSTSVIDKNGIKDKTIPGAISYARRVGKIILKSKRKNYDFIKELNDEIKINEICRGQIIDLIKDSRDSFNVGTIVIENKTDKKKCFVDYKNVNLVVRDEENIIATILENICIFDLDKYNPITTSELSKGMNISISVVPAPEQW